MKREAISFDDYVELESYYFKLLEYTQSQKFFITDNFKKKDILKELLFIEISVKALAGIYKHELNLYKPIKVWSTDKNKLQYIFYFTNKRSASRFMGISEYDVEQQVKDGGRGHCNYYKFKVTRFPDDSEGSIDINHILSK